MTTERVPETVLLETPEGPLVGMVGAPEEAPVVSEEVSEAVVSVAVVEAGAVVASEVVPASVVDSVAGAVVSVEGAVVSVEGAVVLLDGAVVSVEGAVVEASEEAAEEEPPAFFLQASAAAAWAFTRSLVLHLLMRQGATRPASLAWTSDLQAQAVSVRAQPALGMASLRQGIYMCVLVLEQELQWFQLVSLCSSSFSFNLQRSQAGRRSPGRRPSPRGGGR